MYINRVFSEVWRKIFSEHVSDDKQKCVDIAFNHNNKAVARNSRCRILIYIQHIHTI